MCATVFFSRKKTQILLNFMNFADFVIVPNELVRGPQERYSLSIKNGIKMSIESF